MSDSKECVTSKKQSAIQIVMIVVSIISLILLAISFILPFGYTNSGGDKYTLLSNSTSDLKPSSEFDSIHIPFIISIALGLVGTIFIIVSHATKIVKHDAKLFFLIGAIILSVSFITSIVTGIVLYLKLSEHGIPRHGLDWGFFLSTVPVAINMIVGYLSFTKPKLYMLPKVNP